MADTNQDVAKIKTRDQWIVEVEQNLIEKRCQNFISTTKSSWWFYYNNSNNYHLSKIGFECFKLAEINMYYFSFDEDQYINSTIILGLSRMPTPYYLLTDRSGKMIQLWLADANLAMLLKLMDSDLNLFAKGFL